MTKHKGKPDQWWLIRQSEDFFFKKNWHEEPPVKRGLGIDFKSLLRMLRIFTKEIRRKKDVKDN